MTGEGRPHKQALPLDGGGLGGGARAGVCRAGAEGLGQRLARPIRTGPASTPIPDPSPIEGGRELWADPAACCLLPAACCLLPTESPPPPRTPTAATSGTGSRRSHNRG